jgi:hypothetical protein
MQTRLPKSSIYTRIAPAYPLPITPTDRIEVTPRHRKPRPKACFIPSDHTRARKSANSYWLMKSIYQTWAALLDCTRTLRCTHILKAQALFSVLHMGGETYQALTSIAIETRFDRCRYSDCSCQDRCAIESAGPPFADIDRRCIERVTSSCRLSMFRSKDRPGGLGTHTKPGQTPDSQALRAVAELDTTYI